MTAVSEVVRQPRGGASKTAGEVVFYRLSSKLLERDSDIPEKAREVVYYSLAIGHHVGVFDCFTPILRCSSAFYDTLVAALPEGAARKKLDGLRRFGEITIDKSHTRLLGAAIAAVRGEVGAEEGAWLDTLAASLAAIEREPAIYLMGRRR
ncbi:formate hydrogenlyase maturation protein HycH [Rhodoplanes elegans]|uniref:Formate hydrogenlyase maturation protein HycH n=1 Tax=Rhodoplanes elegans TaxID=29408 RepID=A0A327KS04_9BRAD|nr:formate hydrogenlyase maturation HycH family protein [Rhodoplanes elegans]MBK5960054.1 formate hydrogenlyase maturation protein HycH [Rhodoplanes elegans]RAI41629.1 formate hydrogenlyase maturation protein HycH [Rhodoplanes elegans]